MSDNLAYRVTFKDKNNALHTLEVFAPSKEEIVRAILAINNIPKENICAMDPIRVSLEYFKKNIKVLPRALTKEEMNAKIIEHVKALVKYWETVESPYASRVEGMAFSMLTMIDGSTMNVPPLSLYPDTSEDNIACAIRDGENYWPNNKEAVNEQTMLHELFYTDKK